MTVLPSGQKSFSLSKGSKIPDYLVQITNLSNLYSSVKLLNSILMKQFKNDLCDVKIALSD